MNVWEAILLGAIQGATEFLPVSSSGHLVMGQAFLGLELPGILFEVVVHVATLLSVLVVYRSRLLRLARGAVVERSRFAWRYIGYLAVGTFPVAVIGLAFGDWVQSLFDAPQVVGFALLLTGLILFSSRWPLRGWRGDGPPVATPGDPATEGWGGTEPEGGSSPAPGGLAMNFRIALIIGLAQCLALVPGVSRSGTTVVTALWLGVAPVEAAAFSFLLSIPAIAGAAILAAPELTEGADSMGTAPIVAAAMVAAVVGVLAIRTFVAMLRNRSFPAFAGYCWFAGAAFLLWLSF